MDQDQTAPLGAVGSGSTLFAYMQIVSLNAADDISRRHFQMQIFLALYGLNIPIGPLSVYRLLTVYQVCCTKSLISDKTNDQVTS